ncbi:hypothetical protein AB0383_20705 [Amycolatopsis sp. NPDC051373]|uniref:hypothetical protein n=1 Tax=Amycolatopsis sp. NPDC051373 TaxID=3155801 RepID=UPI00344C8ECF
MDSNTDRPPTKRQSSMASTIAPWAAIAAIGGGIGIFVAGANSLLILLTAVGALVWLVCVCMSAFS